MTLFKYFLVLLMRYHKTILTYIVIFLLIGYMTISSINPGESVYEEKKVNFALIDKDESELSKRLTAYLEERNTRKDISLEDNIEEKVFLGYYDVVIVIPEGFSEYPELHKLDVVKNALSAGYYKVTQEISTYMIMLEGSKKAGGEVDYELLRSALDQSVSVDYKVDSSADIGIEEWFSRFLNSASYITIAIIVLVMGTVMSDYNQKKIALRNACAGKSLQLFQSQLILGQVLFGFILSILILLPAIVMTGSRAFTPKLFLYWLNLMALILAILSFTFMLNNVMNNKHALSAIANIFSLGSSFLCGAFIPMEFLSGTTIAIGRFLPSYYFVMANESIYLGTKLWIRDMGVLLLFAAAFLIVGYYIAKTKRSQKELSL